MTEFQAFILFILSLAAMVFFAYSIYKAPTKCDRCPFDCAHCPYDDKDFTIEIFEHYKDHVRSRERNSTN